MVNALSKKCMINQGQARRYGVINYFCHCPKWAIIFKRPLWPDRWTDFNPGVTNQRCGHCLPTIKFQISFLVTAQGIGKLEYFLMLFGQSHTYFYPGLKFSFWKLIFKLLSFNEILIIMHVTYCKWSQISHIVKSWKSS